MKNLIRNTTILTTIALATFATIAVFSPAKKSNADEIDVGLGVTSFIAMSTDTNKLSLETTVNSFTSGVITPSVSTNSAYGYTLRMSAIDEETSLESDTTTDTVTSTFAGTKTSATMPDNTWGFSLDNTNYRRIPVQSSAVNISTSNSPTADSEVEAPVRIGAKVGMLTSGKYSGTLLFTVYTNGADGKPTAEDEDPSWTGEDDGIDPLQRFVCSMLSENGVTATFKDSRDGRQYRVAKLNDGQCWMIDNLAIVDKAITPADSDIEVAFTIPPSTNNSFNTGVFYYGAINLQSGLYNYVNAMGGASNLIKDENNIYTHSLCPKGWRMANRSDYEGLMALYTGDQLLSMPVHIMLTGYNIGGAVSYQSQQGYYWTPDFRDNDTGTEFYIANRRPYFGWSYRNAGYAIRCISRN